MNIGFAGGSTGGHVMPIVSLIQYGKNLTVDAKLFWLGENKSLEETACNKLNQEGIQVKFLPILSGKFRRDANVREMIQNIFDICKLGFGVLQSGYWIIRYSIDIIFCKGGFVSLPVVIAGWILRKKIIVHESDSKPGLSTSLAARFAEHVFCGFPGTLIKGEFVGQILSDKLGECRGGYYPPASKNANIGEQKSFLVNCGSQGSSSVHEALLELFEQYPHLTTDYQWHILLGKLNASYANKYKLYPQIEIIEFADQVKMAELYSICDVSICRGGSTTLAEQQLFGLYQIIIPIPRTHDQFLNATYEVRHGNSVLLDQSNADWKNELYNQIQQSTSYHKAPVDLEAIAHKIEGTKKRIWEKLIK